MEQTTPEVDIETNGLAIPPAHPWLSTLTLPTATLRHSRNRTSSTRTGRDETRILPSAAVATSASATPWPALRWRTALRLLGARVADVQLAGEVTWSGPADALAGPTSLPLCVRPH